MKAKETLVYKDTEGKQRTVKAGDEVTKCPAATAKAFKASGLVVGNMKSQTKTAGTDKTDGADKTGDGGDKTDGKTE